MWKTIIIHSAICKESTIAQNPLMSIKLKSSFITSFLQTFLLNLQKFSLKQQIVGQIRNILVCFTVINYLLKDSNTSFFNKSLKNRYKMKMLLLYHIVLKNFHFRQHGIYHPQLLFPCVLLFEFTNKYFTFKNDLQDEFPNFLE